MAALCTAPRLEEQSRPLPPWVRLLLVPWNLLATAACFTLFTWIVHDRRMPGWPGVLDRAARGPVWPLASGIAAGALVNALLFAAFAVPHAWLARPAVARALGRAVHPQALRTVYMTVTAAGWLLVLFFWQPLGVLVWDLRPLLARAGIGADAVATFSPLLPFAFVLLCLGTVLRHGAFRFVGVQQLMAPASRTDEVGELRRDQTPGAPAPRLITTGSSAVVRHPMYTYLLAAIVVRPVMSLDLALFAACSIVFLAIAVPHEEEKLVAVFGEAYRAYQRKTPAFIPFWPRP